MIAGILLAAGASRRMGQPKLLLPWNGVPLIRHAAATALASSLDRLVVVVGFRAEHMIAALEGLAVSVVTNTDWQAGQSTSLHAGVAAVADADAVLVLLSDQPLLWPDTISRLIEAYCREQAPIVVPHHSGRRGNPVLFARPLFHELHAIEGDRGARQVLEAHATEVLSVEVDDLGVLLDVDTPDAYRTLIEGRNLEN